MNWITEERAQEAGVSRVDGESDSAFAHRVADVLRSQGRVIEAHEALTGKLYDDPDNEAGMLGIMGAVAKELQGRSYPGDEVGTDIAAGAVAQKPRDDSAALLLALIMAGL